MTLSKIFSPSSVAVIGASRDEETIGYAVLANLVDGGYDGKLFAVNPKADEILGLKSYEQITDIEPTIDLAIIVVPDEVVEKVLEECIEKEVKALVIITAGFAETGDSDEEDKLSTIAKDHNLSIIGPNCLGVINTGKELNATFAKTMPSAGSTSFISQSGAIGVYGIEYAAAHGLGFDKFASLGNKAVTSENELLDYLAVEDSTKAVLAYLEDFNDPKQLRKAVNKLVKENKKPLVAIKAGRSESGKRAAASHTGALSGRDEVVDDIFDQLGIIRAQNLKQLFNYGHYFSMQGAPRDKKMAIITNAGGPSIIATDRAEALGLEVPELSDKLQKRIAKNMPDTVSTKNPIDLVGDAGPERFEAALREVMASDEVDMIMLICTPQRNTAMEGIAQAVEAVVAENRHEKVIVASFVGFDDMDNVVKPLNKVNIPNFHFASDAVDTLAAGNSFRLLREAQDTPKPFNVEKSRAEEVLENAKKEQHEYLPAPFCYEIFEAYGLHVCKYGLAKSADEAAAKAEEVGFPVAMSVVSYDIVHKTGTGGVKLHIYSKDSARKAYDQIIGSIKKNEPKATIEGVLVQEMLSGGPEMIMGVQNDNKFGHLLMFGLGGSFVEVLKDVRFKMVPVNRHDVQQMIEKIRAYDLLSGKRGNQPSDIESLEEALLRLSQLVTDFPFIKEIDLNPVYALHSGAVLADARIML